MKNTTIHISIVAGLLVLLFASNAFASIYATDVVSYTLGDNISEGSSRANTASVLGSRNDPGSSGPVNFLSLGLGGDVVLSFSTDFTDSVTIYETTYGRPSSYKEYADVYGSNDGTNWQLLSSIDNQNVDNLGGYTVEFDGVFSFLKIVDTTRENSGVLGDGFDIDAVATSPTPIPGAAWLLGSGLVGLIGLRRKFD